MSMRPNPMPRRTLALCAMLVFAARVSASAATITGTVTNGTTHTPAVGDAVVLIALDQRMQEIAHTKTDAQGHYSIDAPDPGMHLIRVDHQGAAYFQPAPPNTPNVNVQVYDVAAVVPGVSTVANVMRVETDAQGLRVTQFQLSYHLPYSGSLAFDQRFATPTDSFVVMMPKSMSFKPGTGVSFESLNETPNALTFLARNGGPSRPFAFTVSGSGAMPRDTQAESQSNDNGQTTAANPQGGNPQANDTRPGGGL